ncbi:hypothetical protein [Sphingorhabdus wooponensis]|uniref:Uncharacterized protein n=1 Tax=Sphingorhabdus wooponensis TaxID=940136 RepID=A0A426RRA2_9SPHN|nr:hypothetical protein [Sphingorhabdus wooponensis]RRQ51545.1 hypothetical protein D7D48_01195 [Sphingorhabdus wooponensis]
MKKHSWKAFILYVPLVMSGCADSSNDSSGQSMDQLRAELEKSAAELEAMQKSLEAERVQAEQEMRMFPDGTYEYSSLVTGGYQECRANTRCLTLAEYEKICSRVSGITVGLANSWTFDGSGGEAFNQLIRGGSIESIEPRWLGKESWTEDSGVEGACEVRIQVSGIFDGSSTRETGTTHAKEFVVTDGDVLLSRGSISGMGI